VIEIVLIAAVAENGVIGSGGVMGTGGIYGLYGTSSSATQGAAVFGTGPGNGTGPAAPRATGPLGTVS